MNELYGLAGWTRADDYATDAGVPLRKVVRLIRSGALHGRKIDGRWFVAPPLVRLDHPGDGDPTTGLLRISACRLGAWVTAGRGELGIPLSVDDPGRAAALRDLDAAVKKKPGLPVAVRLNGEELLFDASLWLDLAAALVEFEVLTGDGTAPDGHVPSP